MAPGLTGPSFLTQGREREREGGLKDAQEERKRVKGGSLPEAVAP